MEWLVKYTLITTVWSISSSKEIWTWDREDEWNSLKDYDCSILYHLGKANVVANTLNRKLVGNLAHISAERKPIIKEFHDLIDQGLQWKVTKKCLLTQFRVRSMYLDKVKTTQRRDPQL